jgi:SAM-dependent methyltransferase
MERSVYDHMARVAERHHWYVARRRVLAALIGRLGLPPQAQILEIGCGTGHNLDMLARFGTVSAVEIDEPSREMASMRLGRPVAASPLPELAGIEHEAYDLIALLDVLEHLPDDRAALESGARRLRPGGRLLITVPAHPWLWSAHDEANHHFRRYTRAALQQAIGDAGLRIDRLTWFNSLLFPLAVAARLFGNAKGQNMTGDELPWPFPWLLEQIFAAERYAIGRVPFPPGLSLLAVVSRG